MLFFLGQSLVQNIADVVIAQRLLEFLFAGRIDPFADDDRTLPNPDRAGK